MGKKKDAGRAVISPWDNLLISWDTPPDAVHLKTDESVNWPFGDGEWKTELTDDYFLFYLDKAWALCKEEANLRPLDERDAWLQAQRHRLDGYQAARSSKRR